MSKSNPRSGNFPKALAHVRKVSTKEGWTWKQTGNNHMSVFNPQGEFVVMVSSTFYDGMLTRKFLSRLRKAGCPGA
jgi:hypothetical protein